MSTQLENKQRTLAQMLAANRLTKIAADQEIKHTSLTAQKSLGKEQTDVVNGTCDGILASTEAAANKDRDTVDTPPNCQNLNTEAQTAFANTGSHINAMNQNGTPANFPKSASFYRHQLAGILKQANHVYTATEVLDKVASLTPYSSEYELASAQDALLKIASTNQVFTTVRDNILMRKLAEDAQALAEAEGISPEEAASALDAAAEGDPSIIESAADEANGEALASVADAEQGAAELDEGIQNLADNASAALGADVTPDDIVNACADVEAQAEQLGVPPEALIQAAMEDLQGNGEDDVSPEDLENAQAILDEAAANGVSPEEVIDMAANEMADDGDDSGEEEDAGEVKQASYYGYRAATPRAAYVQSLLH